MEDVARREGDVVITSSSEETDERERELVNTLLSRQVEGLLLVPAASDHGYLRPELAMGMQVLVLDRPPGGLDADAALIDNAGVSRDGVEHLLAHGPHRIGLIGDPLGLYTLDERVAGYRSALEAAVVLEAELVVRGSGEVSR